MLKNTLVLVLLILIACTNDDMDNKKLPRIAIAGLAIESSTFSPAQTEEDAFQARVGEDVFSYYPFLSKDSVTRKRAEWFPALRGHALPGGIVTRKAYESFGFRSNE